jgi:hypothetical protein
MKKLILYASLVGMSSFVVQPLHAEELTDLGKAIVIGGMVLGSAGVAAYLAYKNWNGKKNLEILKKEQQKGYEQESNQDNIKRNTDDSLNHKIVVGTSPSSPVTVRTDLTLAPNIPTPDPRVCARVDPSAGASSLQRIIMLLKNTKTKELTLQDQEALFQRDINNSYL